MAHEEGRIAEKTRLSPILIIFAYNVLFMAASGLLVPGIPLYLSRTVLTVAPST
jgi:hypothetical protein